MSEITKAIKAICDEKGLAYEAVLESIEAALAAAYRKDFGNRQQNIKVKFDPETAGMQAWDVKEVVEDIPEDVLEKSQEELARRREEARKENRELTEEEMQDLVRFNPKLQLMTTQAKEVKKDAKVGEILEIPLEIPGEFGRMAAQTAKQVIIQRLREAERGNAYEELKQQEGHLIQGVIQRREREGSIIVDLGKVTGIVPVQEQIMGEQYRPGSRRRFYIVSVELTTRGVEIILSRVSSKMVEEIFAQEIPEIAAGSVEIKGIAREAGNRSKVAVWTDDETIDPIGSCIGQRGSRINMIIDELGGEKIDIIQYNENPEEYIKHALSPAKVLSVGLDKKNQEAVAKVKPEHFSLAIGRGGQNVRLAATLTGWKIKVVQEGGEEKVVASDEVAEKVEETIQPKEDVGKIEEAEKPKEEVKKDSVIEADKEISDAGEKPKKKARKSKKLALSDLSREKSREVEGKEKEEEKD